MTLQIYNTLTNRKEDFKPRKPKHVDMYVCGMTTYDDCHLGHARSFVVFDMVTRYLRHQGYRLNHVRNITDIDDKIIKRAQEDKVKFTDITTKYIDRMDEDFKNLSIIPPDFEPKATEYINEIIAFIEDLIEKGHAYAADNGDVYFIVRSFDEYGKLSGRKIEDLLQGARVEVNEEKRDPLDFVLWKNAKPNEPSWDSPWGPGRPGWHIECSAMSSKLLGTNFDIHGGGQDLIFPHHENEIAQSEACSGHTFANYWMHCGSLRINDVKMSKSLGNFFTIRDVLEKYHPEVIRYFLLSSHYRSPINYSDEALDNAHKALQRIYQALRGISIGDESAEFEDYDVKFMQAMDDDFNTPEAISVVHDMVSELNKIKEHDIHRAAELAKGVKILLGVFGLCREEPEEFLQQNNSKTLSNAQIEDLIEQRNTARHGKDWGRADEIRDELLNAGIALEDKPDGSTIWRAS